MAQSGTYEFPAVGESNYVKLFDGTLIQWGIQSGSVPAGSAYADYVINYPVPFHSSTGNPCVVIGNTAYGDGTSTQTNVCLVFATKVNAAETLLTAFTCRFWKQASVGASTNTPSPVAAWIAIGRWKE